MKSWLFQICIFVFSVKQKTVRIVHILQWGTFAGGTEWDRYQFFVFFGHLSNNILDTVAVFVKLMNASYTSTYQNQLKILYMIERKPKEQWFFLRKKY